MKSIFLAILLAISYSPNLCAQTTAAPARTQTKAPVKAICTEVIDGDTIKLNTGETVRLIGVDTPETVHPEKPVEAFGREASAFTKKIVEGKPVTLHFDQDTKDRYGRTLAYVQLSNGTVLNEAIIAYGYGYAYTQFPFREMDKYREQERRARQAKRGLWAGTPALTVSAATATPVAQEKQVYITPTGSKFHDRTCRHATAGVVCPLSEAQRRGLTACGHCGG